MDGAAKSDLRVPPEQTMLRVSRAPGARIEPDRARAQTRIVKFAIQDSPVIGARPFVGVDIEYPVAARLVDRIISRRREIVMPLIIENAGAVRRGDLTAAITGTRIRHDNLVDEPRDRLQTGADVVFFVSDDQSRRNQLPTPTRKLRLGPPPRAGLVEQLLKHLVGLGADNAVAAGHEGRHAGNAVAVRLRPIGVDRILEAALGQHRPRLVGGEANGLRKLHQNLRVADVAGIDEIRPTQGVVERLAAGLRVRPRFIGISGFVQGLPLQGGLAPPKRHAGPLLRKFHAYRRRNLVARRAPPRNAGLDKIRRSRHIPGMTLPRVQPIVPAWRKAPFDDPDWLFDFKYDGFRGLCIAGRCRFISRDGKLLSRFEALGDQLAAMLAVDEAILDGEARSGARNSMVPCG